MRILQDYQTFVRQKYGGIAKVHYELYSKLKELGEDSRICMLFPQCAYFASQIKVYNYPNKFVRNIVLVLNDIYSFFYCLLQCLIGRPIDLIHVTWYKAGYIKPLFLLLGKKRPKLVVSIYDLIHEMTQDTNPIMRRGVKDRISILKYADAIICISENTKKDLLSYYPDVKEMPISVIHLGVDTVEPEAFDLDVEGKYILFVGNRSDYKNFDGFVKGVSNVLRSDPQLSVFCAGGGAFTEFEKKQMAELGIEDRFVQKTVSDRELSFLYSNAECFVFPSLYEGFGLPTIEAFNYGCPVALHNGSCFPEVAGDAGEYFDGNDADSIEASLKKVLYDRDYRQSLIEKGRARGPLFSWMNTALETRKFYRDIIEKD